MAKTSTAAIALVSRDVKLSKDADETEVSFPVKFSAGHVVTENEAAQLQATYLRAFLGNVRSYVERGEKTYTPDEILAMWNDYELGAPREEGGETIRVEAALRVALAVAREKNPQAVLPRGKGRKGKDGYVSAEDAKAARDAIAQKFLASDRDDIKSRIAAAEADIRAERKAAAEARAPASAVASADDFEV